jgi:hypothetical protein
LSSPFFQGSTLRERNFPCVQSLASISPRYKRIFPSTYGALRGSMTMTDGRGPVAAASAHISGINAGAPATQPTHQTGRKKRAHQKSRWGCTSCKRRKVKVRTDFVPSPWPSSRPLWSVVILSNLVPSDLVLFKPTQYYRHEGRTEEGNQACFSSFYHSRGPVSRRSLVRLKQTSCVTP